MKIQHQKIIAEYYTTHSDSELSKMLNISKYQIFLYRKANGKKTFLLQKKLNKMLTKTIAVFLFGTWVAFETQNTEEVAETKAEYRAVTGYSFTKIPTQKEWITKEVQTKWVLRIRKTFPKNANNPITEVVGYRLHSERFVNEGYWQIEESNITSYRYVVEINDVKIYFN